MAMLVALFGLLMTVAALFAIHNASGVYYSEARVLFLLPASARNPNAYAASTGSLIDAAGIVGRSVSGPGSGSQVVSDQVTIVEQGIKDGWLVRMPNSGGQWATNFDQPVLDVQVAAPTADAVVMRMQDVVGKINAELDRRQKVAGVSSENFIRTRVSPPSTNVFYANGSPMRAMLGALVLGLSLTFVSCRLVLRLPVREGRPPGRRRETFRPTG